MATEANRPERAVQPSRLWFGFAVPAVAWVALGCLDILITWRACMHQEDFGIPNPHPGVRVVFFVLALLLLALTIGAGVVSYRNFRDLSGRRQLLESHAVERREFMAMLGVIISVTLGVGIIWLALPPLFLDLCWRAR